MSTDQRSYHSRLIREGVAPYTAVTDRTTGHTKLSVSLPEDLAEAARSAAAESGLSVSAIVAGALRATLDRAEQARLDAALDLDATANLELATAYGPTAAHILDTAEW